MNSFAVLYVVLTILAVGSSQELPPGGKNWINCTKPFEEYACGSACQTECKTLGEQCPIVNFRCNDACYCIEGYARDASGKCIPTKKCPPKNC